MQMPVNNMTTISITTPVPKSQAAILRPPLPSATGPVAAEDPGMGCLSAGQVGEPPIQGRGGTLAVVTVLLLASLLPPPAGGGGHVQEDGPAIRVTGLPGESSDPLPLLQGQPLCPALVAVAPANQPPGSPGLSVPAERNHWGNILFTHLALIW